LDLKAFQPINILVLTQLFNLTNVQLPKTAHTYRQNTRKAAPFVIFVIFQYPLPLAVAAAAAAAAVAKKLTSIPPTPLYSLGSLHCMLHSSPN